MRLYTSAYLNIQKTALNLTEPADNDMQACLGIAPTKYVEILWKQRTTQALSLQNTKVGTGRHCKQCGLVRAGNQFSDSL